jgi:acyl-CoA thioesterase-1
VVLVLGDSLSAEYGIKRGSGWVQLLSERLEQQKFRWQVVNASVSGETSSGGRSRLPALLQQHRPRIVIIELGANDGLRGLSLDATRQNLRTMIQAAQHSGARVLLVGMQLPPNFGISYTRDFADLFRQLAKERKTALVPFLLEGIAADLSYFQDDRIHPNEKAQVRLLDNVWGGLLPLLK